MSERRAALFDMDRTLVRIDTSTLYVRHQRSKGQASLADALRVGYWMLQYSLGVIDAQRVALKALQSFKGKREQWLWEQCEEMFAQSVIAHVAQAGREAVARHQAQGDFVAIVTGATPYAALPLARELAIEHVVATQLEVADGAFTGRMREPMSYGAGKVVLAERLLAEHEIALEQATFYSDSITDLPLLERVGTPVVINPDARLRRIARKRGWRVEQW